MSRFLNHKNKWVLMVMLVLLAGCGQAGDRQGNNAYLIRIGDKQVTSESFKDALEIAKTAYPYKTLQNEQTVKAIKTRLLKQMTEELILMKKAEELGITVSEAELEKAIASVKEDYPGKQFKKALMENAISPEVWKDRMKIRLLIEKLIEKKLVKQVNITSREIQNYINEHYSESERKQLKPEMIDSTVIKQIRHKKAQKKYPQWINSIQKQYQVELNTKKWKKILG